MNQVLDNTDKKLLKGNIESDETYQIPNFRGKIETVHILQEQTRYDILFAGEIKAH